MLKQSDGTCQSGWSWRLQHHPHQKDALHDFAIVIHRRVFCPSQLNLLSLMFILLESSVRLLCKIDYFNMSVNNELIWQLCFFTFASPQKPHRKTKIYFKLLLNVARLSDS